MKIGFDNDKYLKEQSEEIRRRAGKYGRLYLEFGGKLMNDFHAARCLPGYHPNVKLRLLQSLKDQAEVILCIYAGDIERKKMRADFGISYADDALKLIDDLSALGLVVRGVVVTRYEGQHRRHQRRVADRQLGTGRLDTDDLFIVFLDSHDQSRLAQERKVMRERRGVSGVLKLTKHFLIGQDLARIRAGQRKELTKKSWL